MSMPAVTTVAALAAVSFTGDNAAFRRLVVRGALLELVTFGFYRFWLTTDIRRHLWSHTEIDGDAFEYTGRGKELLIGFLIAMAVLGPVFIVYFLIGLEFERYKAFAAILMAEKPDLVFTQWPVDTHRDHRAASLLTYDAWLGAVRPAVTSLLEPRPGAAA